MKKKAFTKTMEVILALALTFLFITFIVKPYIPKKQAAVTDYLSELQEDGMFRNCVLAENTACINSSLSTAIPARYTYTFSVNTTNITLPEDKNIFVNSLFVAGNLTYYNPKTIWLWYWSS